MEKSSQISPWTLSRNEESLAHKETARAKLRGGREVPASEQKSLAAAALIGQNDFEASDREFNSNTFKQYEIDYHT